MKSVLILVFCSAAALAQNAPVAPYSLDHYGVPWKSGNYEANIMKRAIVQWHGADEYEKVDRYMTEVAMVYQNILYGYLDMPFEMRNTTAYVSFKGEKTKDDITLYKYNVDMYSHDGIHWRQRRMVLDSSFFVVRYFKRPGQDQTESTTGGDYWETTTTTTTGGDYWETTTGDYNWETTTTTTGGDYWETTTGGDYNWETTTGGDYWETTTGGDYWETTTGGDYNWETTTTTTGGDYWETTTGDYNWETTTGGDYWETTTTPASFVRMETSSDDYNWETSSDSYDNWETASDFWDTWYDNWWYDNLDWETSSDSYDNYDFGTTDEPMMG